MKALDWDAFWQSGARLYGSRLAAAVALGVAGATLLLLIQSGRQRKR